MTTVTVATTRNNTFFAALISGAYASAATALLFLIVDGARGQFFYTPSLLGRVVLLGHEPSSTEPLRLDMVALYSLVHLIAFVLIGAAATAVYRNWKALRASVAFGTAVMTFLTGGAFMVGALVYPGLIEAIGPLALIGGNLVAAIAMTVVVRSSLASCALAGDAR